MASKPRKRNPQDATLRNIRALKARVAKLERAVEDLTVYAQTSTVRFARKVDAYYDQAAKRLSGNPKLSHGYSSRCPCPQCVVIRRSSSSQRQ